MSLPATLVLYKLAVAPKINQSLYCVLMVHLCSPHEGSSAIAVSLVDVEIHSPLYHPAVVEILE